MGTLARNGFKISIKANADLVFIEVALHRASFCEIFVKC